MNETWCQFSISKDLSHHLYLDRPAYHARFLEVQEFRAPGLAPVRDASGAYHVEPDGRAAYAARHLGAFGFYEGRAAVQSASGWYHIMANGAPLYSQRYTWCGNFQDGRSAVRMSDSRYFHLTLDGIPAYPARYRYASDFREGYAVVQRDDGMHTHIDSNGAPLHGRWFLDLDVFHNNHARARDTAGWHHVDTRGEPLYERRFQNVEPFYNGQARVEGLTGGLSVIDQTGATIIDLRPPLRSEFDALSAEMVGMWRTQTISAAVELGVFESLPASGRQLERTLRLPPSIGARLLRALAELGLVERDARDVYRVSERGAPLARSHPMSLAAAATRWGREPYTAWGELNRALRTGESTFERLYGRKFFHWLSDRPADLAAYHDSLSAYARHEYPRLVERLDIPDRAHALDAGGGRGDLAFALLRANPTLSATVMDRPEVVENAKVPPGLEDRCRFVAGDLFRSWPDRADTVILARVLHDWPDDDALIILNRARDAMPEGGQLYIVEMALDEAAPIGGLLDLHTLIMTRGEERTPEQFGRLMSDARFEMTGVAGIGATSAVIRGVAR